MAKKTCTCENKNTCDNSELIAKLEAEFNEVADRFERLDASLSQGDKFAKKVGYEQANLLCEQYDAMKEYRNILAIRIALLKRKK